MDYTQLDASVVESAFEVYRKPKFILGKAAGALMRFYSLAETDDGELILASKDPRTVPLSVFNATFSKVSESRAGGVFIRTPSPFKAFVATEDGHLLTRDIESGELKKHAIMTGDYLVSGKSGMTSVYTGDQFKAEFTVRNPLYDPAPRFGRIQDDANHTPD